MSCELVVDDQMQFKNDNVTTYFDIILKILPRLGNFVYISIMTTGILFDPLSKANEIPDADLSYRENDDIAG